MKHFGSKQDWVNDAHTSSSLHNWSGWVCLTVKNIQILIQKLSRWAAPKSSAQSSFRKGSIIRDCLRQFWEFRESSRLKVWDLDSPNSLAFWLLIVEKIDFIETLLRWFTKIRPRFYSLTLSHSICLLVTENTSMTFALSTETKAQRILDKNWTRPKQDFPTKETKVDFSPLWQWQHSVWSLWCLTHHFTNFNQFTAFDKRQQIQRMDIARRVSLHIICQVSNIGQ